MGKANGKAMTPTLEEQQCCTCLYNASQCDGEPQGLPQTDSSGKTTD